MSSNRQHQPDGRQTFTVEEVPRILRRIEFERGKAYTTTHEGKAVISFGTFMDAIQHVDQSGNDGRLWWDGFCSLIRTDSGVTYVRFRFLNTLLFMAYLSPQDAVQG